MYAGLNQKYIQNLVLMSSPVSFANAGQIEYFINQRPLMWKDWCGPLE
jgi:poly(3-hydroxyalkanoate) synthetase